ncbi:hypothetical protein TNIN_279653 [Trichonephila inaurata madagascariensis]|uniref:Uncharacterized protein n=1 Tax=Trichonephila inaurata madagascariensis TaxID=2747483 RepID=A0A8X6K0G5_9ARAC|nr:hypothetical protein TNIN_279653 [Trichonephila inaurata madagascariensis]
MTTWLYRDHSIIRKLCHYVKVACSIELRSCNWFQYCCFKDCRVVGLTQLTMLEQCRNVELKRTNSLIYSSKSYSSNGPKPENTFQSVHNKQLPSVNCIPVADLFAKYQSIVWSKMSNRVLGAFLPCIAIVVHIGAQDVAEKSF